jgi:hypothetical protein
MQAVLRNPLFRLLAQLWWLPALAVVVLALGFGGEAGFPLAAVGVGSLAALYAGLFGAGWAAGTRAVASERRRHLAANHRFLCPHCLCFGEFRYACGACEKEVDPVSVLGKGLVEETCPHCRASLTGSAGRSLRAFCGQCAGTSDRNRYHEREVTVLGALDSGAFAVLSGFFGATGGEEGRLRREDSRRITYLLDLERLATGGSALPPTHAARALAALWLADAEALVLGKAVDRLAAETGLADTRLAEIRVCVGARELEPAAQRALASRFGAVEYGKGPVEFLRGQGVLTGSPNETEEAHPDSDKEGRA